jgi:hypothetical protein
MGALGVVEHGKLEVWKREVSGGMEQESLRCCGSREALDGVGPVNL